MTSIILKVKVKNKGQLFKNVLDSAVRYCKVDIGKRQEFISNDDIYVRIDLWDGRLVTAHPIKSSHEFNLNQCRDFVFMDGRIIDVAIEANLECMLVGEKSMFVTYSDIKDSNDMLLWQITDSSTN